MNKDFFTLKDNSIHRICPICCCTLNLNEFNKANKEKNKETLIIQWCSKYVAIMCCDCINTIKTMDSNTFEETENNFPIIIHNLLKYGLI